MSFDRPLDDSTAKNDASVDLGSKPRLTRVNTPFCYNITSNGKRSNQTRPAAAPIPLRSAKNADHSHADVESPPRVSVVNSTDSQTSIFKPRGLNYEGFSSSQSILKEKMTLRPGSLQVPTGKPAAPDGATTSGNEWQ